MRRFVLLAVMFCFFVAATQCFAQQAAAGNMNTTTCTFADGQQISMRYSTNPKQDTSATAWGPGGSPMYLFTQTKTSLNNTEIPVGAFSVYLTGKPGNWTLIVNKDVNQGAKYDRAQDLVRAPMDSGKLGSPTKQMQVYFVHPSPQACTLRIYYQDTGYFAEFEEK